MIERSLTAGGITARVRARPVAIQVRTGEPATVQIVSAAQEISTGDRLIAVATPSVLQYVPHAPTSSQ